MTPTSFKDCSGPPWRWETDLAQPVRDWLSHSALVVAEEIDGGAGVADFVGGYRPRHAFNERLTQCPAVIDWLQLALLTRCQPRVSTDDLRSWAPWGWRGLNLRAIEPLLEVGLLTNDGSSYQATCTPEDPFTSLVAVELKLRDWRRGLSQASRYRLFAERSYLALPHQRISQDVVDEAHRQSVVSWQ